MQLLDIIYFGVIGLYTLGTLFFFLGVALKNKLLHKLASALAVVGFLLHCANLWNMLSTTTTQLAANFYISFLAWVLIALWFILWWRLKSHYLGLTALPLALLLFVGSVATSGIKVTFPPILPGLFFGLHIGSLAITLGLLALGFGSGITWLHINKKLKTKVAPNSLDATMPSLSIFDTVNHWAITLGFPLYTLGIFSSFIWYWLEPKRTFSWDFMKIASLTIWLFFAFAFHQRLVMGWKGRKPALLAIWLFGFLLMYLVHHTISFKP